MKVFINFVVALLVCALMQVIFYDTKFSLLMFTVFLIGGKLEYKIDDLKDKIK